MPFCEADQPQFAEPSRAHRHVFRRTARQTPPSLARSRQTPRARRRSRHCLAGTLAKGYGAFALFDRATDILRSRRPELDEGVKLLLAQETLTAEQFASLRPARPQPEPVS
jgi:hypothetical protein